jgi:hypothetical protein
VERENPERGTSQVCKYVDRGQGLLPGVKLRSLEKRQGSRKPGRVKAGQKGKSLRGGNPRKGTGLAGPQQCGAAFEANGSSPAAKNREILRKDKAVRKVCNGKYRRREGKPLKGCQTL